MSTQAYPAPSAAYPAHLDGRIDPGVSRWLWLVKWLLVIPHAFLLTFLGLAAFVLTVVAGFAILFTGRYPRALFDFNVGVMRWAWRVSFYAIGAFATDRYPPFTLNHDPSYPADFDVEYPEHLSRGLVLVKWWLLAIPQYVIVGILASGWGWGWDGGWGGGWGLIAVLAIIAAVILGFTGRYPEQMFDLVMGLNRWVYRVMAYAALMRDEYPPFRLDLGGRDPGNGVQAASPAGPMASPPGSGPPPGPPPVPPGSGPPPVPPGSGPPPGPPPVPPGSGPPPGPPPVPPESGPPPG